jgi:hypothetical protein
MRMLIFCPLWSHALRVGACPSVSKGGVFECLSADMASFKSLKIVSYTWTRQPSKEDDNEDRIR